MGITITSDVKVKPGVGPGSKGDGSGGDDPFDKGPGGPKDWPPGFSREDAIEPHKYRIGMWVGLASILMLFIALTSAYILRQTTGLSSERNDWVQIAVPPVLWFTTGILVLSSISMEIARRAMKRTDYPRFKRWILATTALGVVFLAGQFMAWRELAAQGIYISSNPHSSFFYLLTSLHAIHLLGGVLALSYVSVAALRLRVGIKKRPVVDVTALYWHFMDGLWIYLFLLLFFWK